MFNIAFVRLLAAKCTQKYELVLTLIYFLYTTRSKTYLIPTAFILYLHHLPPLLAMPSPGLLFLPSLSVPLSSPSRPLVCARRPRLAPRAVADDPISREESIDSNPKVGGNVPATSKGPASKIDGEGVVPPQEFEQIGGQGDVVDAVVGELKNDIQKPKIEADIITDDSVHGILDTEQELKEKLEQETVELNKVTEPKDESEDKKEAVKETVAENIDSQGKIEEAQKEDEDTKGSTSVGLNLSPEQLAEAKQARADAMKASEEVAQAKKDRNKQILLKVESAVVTIGTKTGVFGLGEKARAKAEDFVQSTIAAGDVEKASQGDKLKAKAMAAAKATVAALVVRWEENVVPLVKDNLGEEFGGITNKAMASVAVGAFVAIALLPSLFAGGSSKMENKKIDIETAGLEKKLPREKVGSTYSARKEKSVFPPEDEDLLSKSRKKTSPSSIKEPATSKVAEAPKAPDALAPSSNSPAMPPKPVPTPVPQVTPVEPPQVASPAPVAKVAVKPVPEKPVDVTPPMILSAVKKSVGSSAGYFTSASFESLSEQPTVVLQVTKAFHQLPAKEQRLIAAKALKSSRDLGYDSISFIEEGTSIEVAYAGISVNLEDEISNMKAELAALKRQADQLSTQNTEEKAEIDKLQNRMLEERDEFATEKNKMSATISNIQKDNSGLVADLEDAKQEISKMPDRLVLEERTLEAEKTSEKLSETVEMLSKQLAKARADEAAAKEVEIESLASVKKAERIKDEALASVAGQVRKAQEDADKRATSEILAAQKEAEAAINLANKRIQDSEETLTTSQMESAKALEDSKTSFEKQLAVTKQDDAKELSSVREVYEAKLNELQKKAEEELNAYKKEADKKITQAQKEAKDLEKTLSKERDQAIKETEKVRSQGEKAAAKAERERNNLKSRIAKLEAKLKGGEKVESTENDETVEVGSS